MAFNAGACSRSTILQFVACLSLASQAEWKPPKTIECHRAQTTTALPRLGDDPNCAPGGGSYDFASLLVFKEMTPEGVEVRLARPSAKIRDRSWLMLRLWRPRLSVWA